MFSAYEFSFNGVSCKNYGLMLYDIGGNGQSEVSFGNKASIVETRTNNRIQPIHLGVNYHGSPLEFKLVFGSFDPIDRYQMQEVAMWLTGHQDYKWLTIDQPDLHNVQFKCLITSLSPIHVGWLPYAFEAHVKCDCPYAYGFPYEELYSVVGTTEILFRNESSVREYIKPILKITPNEGVTEIKIVNKSDNDREFILSDLPASGLEIVIDNNSGIIKELSSDYNLYSGFNLNLFRLVPGDNVLEVTGDGVYSISGRFLYNVAG